MPVWIDVLSNNKMPCNTTGGLLAVRDLTQDDTGYIMDLLGRSEDHYLSSLYLLTWLVLKDC
ncbi:hypothetical protein LJN55_22850 [Erwinia rhapontici]|nr:hypothetical protein LJN55_22850 [Erwinia rhapontici]